MSNIFNFPSKSKTGDDLLAESREMAKYYLKQTLASVDTGMNEEEINECVEANYKKVIPVVISILEETIEDLLEIYNEQEK